MNTLAQRKSPIQKRSTITVNAILEAAAQVLETRGVAEFTTNAIALRAGVSIGTLYQYFPDKNAIVAALSRANRSGLVDAVAQAVAAGQEQSLETALRLLVAAALRHDLERPHFGRILDLLEAHLPIEAETEAVYRNLNASLVEFLSSRFDETDRKLSEIADNMRAITQALSDRMRQSGGRDGPAVIDEITRILLAALPVMLESREQHQR